MFKIGSQLFTSAGPEAVKQVSALGTGVFLDLKFHDIPNTVAGAVLAAAAMPGVQLLNIHALGGTAMIRAAEQCAVPVLRDVPLAHVLIELPVGQEIPETLYEAVSEVLREVGAHRRAKEQDVTVDHQ